MYYKISESGSEIHSVDEGMSADSMEESGGQMFVDRSLGLPLETLVMFKEHDIGLISLTTTE